MDKNLIDYIKQNKQKGFSDDQIKKALLGAGWKQEDINKRFKSPGKKPKWLIPVIVIVGVIVLGLIVWGGYELFKPAPPENEGGAEEGDGLPEDETADLPSEDLSKEGWETYRNEEYGWEVQYPRDWTAKNLIIDGKVKDNVIILSGGKISEAVTAPTKDVSITFVENPTGLSIEQKVEQDCEKQPEGWCKYYQNPNEIIVGGTRTLKYENIPG